MKSTSKEGPSKQQLTEMIAASKYQMDQLQYSFLQQQDQINARFISCEYLCNSQQRQIDQQNLHIKALRNDISAYKDSLLEDLSAFKEDFTITKHDVFLKQLAQIEIRLSYFYSQHINNIKQLQILDQNLQSEKNSNDLKLYELRENFQKEIDEYRHQQSQIQSDIEKQTGHRINKKVIKILFQTIADEQGMERLYDYTQQKVKNAMGEYIKKLMNNNISKRTGNLKEKRLPTKPDLPIIEKQGQHFIFKNCMDEAGQSSGPGKIIGRDISTLQPKYAEPEKPVILEENNNAFKLALPIKINYQPIINKQSKPYIGSALKSLEELKQNLFKLNEISTYVLDRDQNDIYDLRPIIDTRQTSLDLLTRLLADSILELNSLFEANKNFQMSADIEKENKLRDFRYIQEDYKDQINLHEAKIKQQLEEEFQANRKKWIKEKGNWEVMKNAIDEKVRVCALRAKKNEDIQVQVVTWVNKISNSCQMTGALLSQDELDRRGISLIGHSSEKSNTVLNIDLNCLSCIRSSANQQEKTRVLNAFKIACLQYLPSKVLFQTVNHERIDLISQTQRILDEFSNHQMEIDRLQNTFADQIQLGYVQHGEEQDFKTFETHRSTITNLTGMSNIYPKMMPLLDKNKSLNDINRYTYHIKKNNKKEVKPTNHQLTIPQQIDLEFTESNTSPVIQKRNSKVIYSKRATTTPQNENIYKSAKELQKAIQLNEDLQASLLSTVNQGRTPPPIFRAHKNPLIFRDHPFLTARSSKSREQQKRVQFAPISTRALVAENQRPQTSKLKRVNRKNKAILMGGERQMQTIDQSLITALLPVGFGGNDKPSHDQE